MIQVIQLPSTQVHQPEPRDFIVAPPSDAIQRALQHVSGVLLDTSRQRQQESQFVREVEARQGESAADRKQRQELADQAIQARLDLEKYVQGEQTSRNRLSEIAQTLRSGIGDAVDYAKHAATIAQQQEAARQKMQGDAYIRYRESVKERRKQTGVDGPTENYYDDDAESTFRELDRVAAEAASNPRLTPEERVQIYDQLASNTQAIHLSQRPKTQPTNEELAAQSIVNHPVLGLVNVIPQANGGAKIEPIVNPQDAQRLKAADSALKTKSDALDAINRTALEIYTSRVSAAAKADDGRELPKYADVRAEVVAADPELARMAGYAPPTPEQNTMNYRLVQPSTPDQTPLLEGNDVQPRDPKDNERWRVAAQMIGPMLTGGRMPSEWDAETQRAAVPQIVSFVEMILSTPEEMQRLASDPVAKRQFDELKAIARKAILDAQRPAGNP